VGAEIKLICKSLGRNLSPELFGDTRPERSLKFTQRSFTIFVHLVPSVLPAFSGLLCKTSTLFSFSLWTHFFRMVVFYVSLLLVLNM
jgi:hypothetical protein